MVFLNPYQTEMQGKSLKYQNYYIIILLNERFIPLHHSLYLKEHLYVDHNELYIRAIMPLMTFLN